MARTPSNMMPLGTIAPPFNLPDTIRGQMHSLNALKGSHGTLVMFICNHCPFVVHIMQQCAQLANAAQTRGIAAVAISSNDAVNYPQDAPAKMATFAQQYDFEFPYLYDESQDVAKAYDAACTPDFYLFDADLRCVYRGQFDDARPGSPTPITGKDLQNAIDQLLAGEPINSEQTPSLGCNIKWK